MIGRELRRRLFGMAGLVEPRSPGVCATPRLTYRISATRFECCRIWLGPNDSKPSNPIKPGCLADSRSEPILLTHVGSHAGIASDRNASNHVAHSLVDA
jgi:hypothetical protein